MNNNHDGEKRYKVKFSGFTEIILGKDLKPQQVQNDLLFRLRDALKDKDLWLNDVRLQELD